MSVAAAVKRNVAHGNTVISAGPEVGRMRCRGLRAYLVGQPPIIARRSTRLGKGCLRVRYCQLELAGVQAAAPGNHYQSRLWLVAVKHSIPRFGVSLKIFPRQRQKAAAVSKHPPLVSTGSAARAPHDSTLAYQNLQVPSTTHTDIADPASRCGVDGVKAVCIVWYFQCCVAGPTRGPGRPMLKESPVCFFFF